jgi:phosphinothricin acetyltransferase
MSVHGLADARTPTSGRSRYAGAVLIRHATDEDVPGIAAIRAHYVLNSHSTFDTVPPTTEEMREWISQFADGTPYQLLVAVEDDVLLGYAATLRYRPKPAFDGTVELTVYLAPNSRSRGVGSALYTELFARSARQGTRTYLAGVALPNAESLAFHQRHGFVEVGTFIDSAQKWGRPISSTWLQKRV